MIDINDMTIGGRVVKVDSKDSGNVAIAHLFIHTDDTPPQYGDRRPEPKHTEHKVVCFGEIAHVAADLRRGDPVVVSCRGSTYQGETRDGKPFKSYQIQAKRIWAPGMARPETQAQARPQQQRRQQEQRDRTSERGFHEQGTERRQQQQYRPMEHEQREVEQRDRVKEQAGEGRDYFDDGGDDIPF